MKFFKCENGTIISIKDIRTVVKDDKECWTVRFNCYAYHDGEAIKYLERGLYSWFSAYDEFTISITQADYERLVRVLEEEGMLR